MRIEMKDNNLYDMAFLNKVSGGDENFIREMVNTFKEIAPEYLEKAKGYLKNDQLDALAKETHRVIPGVTFVGAKPLEAELMLIEEYAKKRIHTEQIPLLLDKCEALVFQLIEVFNHDFS